MQSKEDSSAPTNPFSDEALIQAISEGAVWAIEALYQRYEKVAYSLCYRMVTDHQAAQNILQESFMAVWQRADSYHPHTGKVYSWLLTIVRYRTIDYLRGLRRRSQLREIQLEYIREEEHPTQPDSWEEVLRSLLVAQVRAALLRLRPEQREMIELAYFQGWTHSEIAQEYHIPLGTVKSRIRCGLRDLKQTLESVNIDEL